MIGNILDFLNNYLGLNAPVLNIFQMGTRAVIVYTLAIILVRMSKKRFLAKPSSFDLVLIFIFGGVLSRGITNNPFLPTIVAGIVLIMLHTFFSFITFYSTNFGAIIKGRPLILVKDGEIVWNNMQRSHITERDLFSALRRNAHIVDISKVKLAVLERNGEISVIPFGHRKVKPEIMTVDVKDGVQTVRIEFK